MIEPNKKDELLLLQQSLLAMTQEKEKYRIAWSKDRKNIVRLRQKIINLTEELDSLKIAHGEGTVLVPYNGW